MGTGDDPAPPFAVPLALCEAVAKPGLQQEVSLGCSVERGRLSQGISECGQRQAATILCTACWGLVLCE